MVRRPRFSLVATVALSTLVTVGSLVGLAGAMPPARRSLLVCGGLAAQDGQLSLKRGLECRLVPGEGGLGKITALEPGALRIRYPMGQFDVTARVTLVDATTVRIEAASEMSGGLPYELRVDPTRIRHSFGEPMVANGHFEGTENSYRLCFKPDEDAAQRLRQGDHGCPASVRIR